MVFNDRLTLVARRWGRHVDGFCARLNPLMLAIAVILAAANVVLGSARAFAPQFPEWALASAEAESGIPHVPIAVPP